MNKQIQHPIRFAIVGTGFSEQHLNWMNKVDGLCCNALLYHSNSERAFALAKDFGIRNVSNDLDEIIGSKDIDGVVIVSPPDTHEQIALAALSHNLLVICDKPLSSTLESAELLCKHDAEYGGKSKLMFQWRLHPALLGAKSKIELGSLGDILHMSLSFQHDFLANRTTATPWRHSYLRAGGGALGDMGVHLFDLIHFLPRLGRFRKQMEG
jgi:predicted dehydrogenase